MIEDCNGEVWVSNFSRGFFQIDDGVYRSVAEQFDLEKLEVRALYEDLVAVRVADQMALRLQREGRMGTYAPMWGQEAGQAAVPVRSMHHHSSDHAQSEMLLSTDKSASPTR